MIKIEIKPATRTNPGVLRVTGHGSTVDLCNAVTALYEGLAANLDNCWDIRVRRRAIPGDAELMWYKTDKAGRGVSRANSAAGFVYVALKALALAWPEVEVTRLQPWEGREIATGLSGPRNDKKREETK